MSDARLRHLQRAAAAGDRDAQAKLLVERVRSGELSDDRLRLAAHLGDPASLAALSESAEFALTPRAWSKRLVAIADREAAVRVGLAGAWVASHQFPHLGIDMPSMTGEALRAVEQWIRNPTGELAADALRVSVLAEVQAPSVIALAEAADPLHPTGVAGQAARAAATAPAHAATLPGTEDIAQALDLTLAAARLSLCHGPAYTSTELAKQGATHPAMVARLERMIRIEVLPWVLGEFPAG